MIWDQELNDSEYATLQSEHTISSESLMRATRRFEGFFNSRAKYTEDALKLATKQGIKQYVILGAGMDTFAFRQPETLEQLEYLKLIIPLHKNLSFIVLLSWGGTIQQNYILFL